MASLKTRNWGLDLMRTIAIVFVLFYHWMALNLGGKEFQGSIFYSSILGYYGVELFFVLSGFLIGNILINIYLKEPEFSKDEITNFWMRRWLRTLPLYYFILIIHITVALTKKQYIDELWKYVLFLQNIFEYNTHNENFYGVSWSLSVEEWFYLTFPIALSFINIFSRQRLSKQHIFLTTILLYLAIPLLVRLYYSYSIPDISWNNILRKAVVCREDSIAFGVLGAYIFKFHSSVFHKNKVIFFVLGTILLILSAVLFLDNVAEDYYFEVGGVYLFSKTLLFTVVSLGSLLLIPQFYNIKSATSMFSKAVTHVSKISYSLYLIHLFVGLFIRKVFKLLTADPSILNLTLNLLLYLLIVALLSTLTFQYIEEKFLLLRDKFWKEEHAPLKLKSEPADYPDGKYTS